MLKYVVSFSQKVGFLLVRSCSQFQGRRNQPFFSPNVLPMIGSPDGFEFEPNCFFCVGKKQRPEPISQSVTKKNDLLPQIAFWSLGIFWGDPNDIFSVSVFG